MASCTYSPLFPSSSLTLILTDPQLSKADAIAAQNPYISYCVSKAEAEKAIWTFVSDHKPHFSVSVLLPALIFGPAIQPVRDLKKINFSTDRFYELFNGSLEVVPPTAFPSYVSPILFDTYFG
jgi:nucleoside-diphosphate-sugar epimerase